MYPDTPHEQNCRAALRAGSEHAFTLTEVLIASTILLLAVAASLSVFLAVSRSSYALSDAMDLNARTRLVQDRIALDVRSIKAMSTATGQSFTCTCIDFGSSASGNDSILTVTYAFADGVLTRTSTDVSTGVVSTAVVMRGLVTDPSSASSSKFEFYNRSGSSAASTGEIRSIKFRITPAPTIRQQLKLVGGRNEPFSTAIIQLRNLLGS